jgi:hypothetical protein
MSLIYQMGRSHAGKKEIAIPMETAKKEADAHFT